MTNYVCVSDKSLLDVEMIHGFLAGSYWAAGIPRSVVEMAISNSLCVGVYRGSEQVGFARVVTDCATFGYLADVFVLKAHREQGLAHQMLQHLFAQPELQGLRRIMLATRDAHALYRQFGFTSLTAPERMMELLRQNVYAKTDNVEA
jgi:N-acetylglutamate synthase-like GNAT family acetyltransferase